MSITPEQATLGQLVILRGQRRTGLLGTTNAETDVRMCIIDNDLLASEGKVSVEWLDADLKPVLREYKIEVLDLAE
ncbi:MAG: hypothetical protein NW206_19625 [Hyphomonadaceae bacterium]|nr:hypothetical protein [Hyphomonadaceae bacterium]